jgi:soluble cytochrome b562
MGTPVESSDSGEVTEPTTTSSDQGGNSSPGTNPAWNDVLSVIPEQLHSQVTSHFQKWDQAANSKISSLNSQLEQYKPFMEHGIDGDILTQGVQLLYQLQNDPKSLYDALVQNFNFSPEEAAEAVEEATEESENSNPEFKKLQDGFELLAQHVLNQENQKQEAAADAQLDKDLKAAAEKHGEFDEPYVLYQMYTHGKSMDEAVQAYQDMANGILQKNQSPFAPNILGSSSGNGSGLPSQATDVTKLNNNDTKALVAQMLKAQLG